MPRDRKDKQSANQENEAFSIDPVFDRSLLDEASEETVSIKKSEKREQIRQKPQQEVHLRSLERPNAWKRFWMWFWDKKWFTLPAVVCFVVAILLAVPATRYVLVGTFWKESVVIRVIDDGNSRPVSEATVMVAGVQSKTDAKGNAALVNVPVGVHDVTIEKKNYQATTTKVEVPLVAGNKTFDMSLHATGRITDVAVANRLSGNAVKGALVTVSQDDKAKTDDTGKAQVVIATDKKAVTVTVTAEGYLEQKVEIAPSKSTTVELVPMGKMYFLSKQRGKIDVVRTNLDGTGREVAIEATGNETDQNTSLLASRDWRYLLLKAQRETGKGPSLYLYDTTKGSLELLDRGDKTDFNLIGWSGHNFFYHVYRDRPQTDVGVEAIKIINAQSQKVSVVDESQVAAASPYAKYRQTYPQQYILDGGIMFTRSWMGPGQPQLNELTTDIVRINSDGGGKKVIKSFPATSTLYVDTRLVKPQTAYYKIYKGDQSSLVFAELNNWVYREGVKIEGFDAFYPTYLMSPDGTMSFWSESRDGKHTLLVGDKNALNSQALLSMSEYKAYGWLTNEFILLQKNDSELYIASPAQLKAGKAPLKISNYHKPVLIPGYGYGYGGQ